jgi:hypothetical protein
MIATKRPISSDFCSPRIVCANTSPPICVVPNQWSGDGGFRKDVKSWPLYVQPVMAS